MNAAPGLIAGGDIEPSRFVKLSTTADHTGLQCTANAEPIGISQVGSFDPPGLTGSATKAAAAGQPIQIFGEGEICLLQAGVSGFIAGDDLKSDADGKGIVAASTEKVGAKALETVSAGEYGRVQVLLFTK